MEREKSMSKILKQVQNDKIEESGRSMVETLGVLAVMGVISIGGLYGYTYAMKRHRANELINEANKRAVMVASQIAMGREPSDKPDQSLIGEFTDPERQRFNVGKRSNKQFYIEISDVSEDVCEQMRKVVGGVIVDFSPQTCSIRSENTVELVFNNDLSLMNGTSGGANENDSSEEVDSACEGVTCTGADEVCDDGRCVKPAIDDGCSKNSDCNNWCTTQKANDSDIATCFCYIKAKYTGTENACYNNFEGTCDIISNSERMNRHSSTNGYTWWSAKNFCKAINRQIPSKQSACKLLDDDCISTPPTYWLSDCYGTNCTDNSCQVFGVGTYYSSIINSRRDSIPYVLCE